MTAQLCGSLRCPRPPGPQLFKSLHLAMARVPGSLAVATIVTCAVFATATGIVGAVVTLMGLLAFPLSRARARQGKYAKLRVAVLSYATVYNLIMVAKTWVEKEVVGTIPGIWWVHILLAILVAGLLWGLSWAELWQSRWRRSARAASDGSAPPRRARRGRAGWRSGSGAPGVRTP